MKIKYLVFGHNHFDHTGGGEYIQRMTGAKAVMHRDDWEIYLKSTGPAAAADAAADAAPTPAATPRRLRRAGAGGASGAAAEDDSATSTPPTA